MLTAPHYILTQLHLFIFALQDFHVLPPTTQHDGVEVESILIDETKVGQASCQLRPGNGDLPREPRLQAP